MPEPIDGCALGGQLGPVFLLAPLAFIAIRTAAGRQLLLAALVFVFPYFGNIGTRFLVPAIFYAVEKLSGARVIATGLAPSPAQGD